MCVGTSLTVSSATALLLRECFPIITIPCIYLCMYIHTKLIFMAMYIQVGKEVRSECSVTSVKQQMKRFCLLTDPSKKVFLSSKVGGNSSYAPNTQSV